MTNGIASGCAPPLSNADFCTGNLMGLHIKPLHGGGFQVENETGHWVVFSLDELRSHALQLRADMVEGSPKMPENRADLFIWAAFAAARGCAVEHGLIDDDRPPRGPSHGRNA